MPKTSNHLGEAIDIADVRAPYDANAKNLLSDKVLIAEIVKRLFPEFKSISKENIPQYINGSPLVGKVNQLGY